MLVFLFYLYEKQINKYTIKIHFYMYSIIKLFSLIKQNRENIQTISIL